MKNKSALWLPASGVLLVSVGMIFWSRPIPPDTGARSNPETDVVAAGGGVSEQDNSAGGTATPSPSSGVPAAPAAGTSSPATVHSSTSGSGPADGFAGRRPRLADLLPDNFVPADRRQREEAVERLKSAELRRLTAVQERAMELGISRRVTGPGNRVAELYDIIDGEPLYKTTLNRNAAISGAADVLLDAPFGLDGAGVKVGVWDAGAVRNTHREFDPVRVLRRDGAGLDDHATHVAGTIGAAGFMAAAKGMAPRVSIDSYDWNLDYAEMLAAGAATAGGLGAEVPVSNHSYGFAFFSASSYLPWMGRYEDECATIDELASKLPYYLIFWAAGNDQDFITFKGGYQSITFNALAKNIMTVGAVNDAVSGGRRDPSRGTMSTFSSWGPCDDGRIKPDVVANGVSLYSPIDSNDSAYATYSGTSMATPAASGAASLLVQLYAREFGGVLMPASMLKALMIHTADDRGQPGPDYQFGWGLINAKAAAEVILGQKEKPMEPMLRQGSVSPQSPRQTIEFTWDGMEPIRVTLCWTDPAGVPQTQADSRTPNLVHDLNLKVTAPDGGVHYPFVMPFVGTWTDASMRLAATTGINQTDNVEQVLIRPGAAVPGTYTLEVSYRGALQSSAQAYSLVVTGSGEPTDPPPVVTWLAPSDGAVVVPGESVTLRATATDLVAFGEPGAIRRVEFLANEEVIHSQVIEPSQQTVEFAHLWMPAYGKYALVARAVDNEGGAGASVPLSIDVRYPLPGEVVGGFTAPAADGAVRSVTSDDLGRVYIAGSFSALNTTFASPRLARLRPTGEPDTTFRVGQGFNGDVRSVLHSPRDRGIYAGGPFTTVRGNSRPGLVRLAVGQPGLTDGQIDPSFVPSFDGASPVVNALAMQPDGKLLVGGLFSMSSRDGVRKWSNLVRLLPDGSIDEDFGASGGDFLPPNPNGAVNALCIQPDGRVLVGGSFGQVFGVARRGLARLHPDGSADTSLAVGSGTSGGFNGSVQALAVAPDGSIYAGGSFSSYRGNFTYNNLVKLSSGGVLEGRFNFSANASGGLNGAVNTLLLRPTGEVFVGGLFTQVSNAALPVPATAVGRFVQLRNDGSLDADFNAGGQGANNSVHGATVLSDGDLLVVGAFESLNGEPARRIARLAGSDGLVPLLTSGQWRTSAAGELLEWRFTAVTAEGNVTFELVGPDGLPLALAVDPATGFLSGVPLPLGVSFDPATGRLVGRPMEAGSFLLHVRPVRQPSQPGGPVSPGAVTPFNLMVPATKVSYEQWRQTWFRGEELADEMVSGAGGALSPSGLSNFAVYALWGGHPKSAGPGVLPQSRFEWHRGWRYLTFSTRKNPLAMANFKVEFSDGLPAWHEAGSGAAAPVLMEEEADLLKYRAAVPAASADRQFFRLRISPP